MKKRLAIWTFGGIGTGHFSQGHPVLEQLLNGISDTFDIVVYSRSRPNPDFRSNYFIVRCPSANIRYSIPGWLSLIGFFLLDHRKKKYDIILGLWGWPTGWITTVLGKTLGIRNAVYLLGADAAGIPSINYGIFHRPLLRRLAAWTYHRTDRLFSISRYQKDQLSGFGINRPIGVIPWGVDKSQYSFHKKSRADVLHFIHVGHLSLVKDQGTLLRAFAIISKTWPSQLMIFGTDCLDGAMQKLCRELGIEDHVSFRDMVPYSEMPRHYEWADIMLHTSFSEGQSMALTEAAASGVLLAGTKVGLLYDLGDAGGLTVDIGDFGSLASKVLGIIEDPDEWNSRIDVAKAWSDEHSLDWTINELKKGLNAR